MRKESQESELPKTRHPIQTTAYTFMSKSIRPLTGQVLIRLLSKPEKSDGEIFFPEVFFDEYASDKKAKPRRGLVIACGPWKKTKTGFAILPEIKPGDEVLVSEYRGTKLTREIGETLRICRLEDVLALIEKGAHVDPC